MKQNIRTHFFVNLVAQIIINNHLYGGTYIYHQGTVQLVQKRLKVLYSDIAFNTQFFYFFLFFYVLLNWHLNQLMRRFAMGFTSSPYSSSYLFLRLIGSVATFVIPFMLTTLSFPLRWCKDCWLVSAVEY